VFAAWVLWHNEQPARTDRFDWRVAAYYLHVPVLQALFEQVSQPSRLKPLNLVDVLDWTGAALNRVERAAFFATFEAGHAVQYFYEPFLEAFDPQLRKQLGVWYTPPEVVRYMVARVDRVLRDELGVADGLADPHVHILDPCCGTGAYLVEVLRSIEATLKDKGDAALLGEAFNGILGSDRLSAYNSHPSERRQLCWAHLQRNLRAIEDRARRGGGVGERGAGLGAGDVPYLACLSGRDN
jgi:hypothetical protein